MGEGRREKHAFLDFGFLHLVVDDVAQFVFFIVGHFFDVLGEIREDLHGGESSSVLDLGLL